VKLLTEIPCPLDADKVLSRLNAGSKEKHVQPLEKLVAKIDGKINPVLLYRECSVKAVDNSSVLIDGVRFQSRILRVNLEKTKNAFPYILTCGKAFEDLSSSLEDMLDRYYLEEIANVVLSEAQAYFLDYLGKNYGLENVSKMNPGSLPDWPLEQQKPLFSLFDKSPELASIQVRLEENMLMTPLKSLSGIAFPSDGHFENCQMCPQENCPGRKEPYDETMKDLYIKPDEC